MVSRFFFLFLLLYFTLLCYQIVCPSGYTGVLRIITLEIKNVYKEIWKWSNLSDYQRNIYVRSFSAYLYMFADLAKCYFLLKSSSRLHSILKLRWKSICFANSIFHRIKMLIFRSTRFFFVFYFDFLQSKMNNWVRANTLDWNLKSAVENCFNF